MSRFLVVIFFQFSILQCYSQKPPVNPLNGSSLDWNWPSAQFAKISNNGKYVSYVIENLPAGAATLVFKAIKDDWRHEFILKGPSSYCFTADSKEAIVFVSDSVLVLSLGASGQSVIGDIISFAPDKKDEADKRIAYLKKTGELVVRNLSTQQEESFAKVSDYAFSDDGSRLMVVSTCEGHPSDCSEIVLVNFKGNVRRVIWNGASPGPHCFDSEDRALAFFVTDKGMRSSLWYYTEGMDYARELIADQNRNIDSNLILDPNELYFDKKGRRVFFKLIEKPFPASLPDLPKVDVWNYKDVQLQSKQLQTAGDRQSFLASMLINSSMVVRLQYENEQVTLGGLENSDYIVATTFVEEAFLQKVSRSSMYLVSTKDGKRKEIYKVARRFTRLTDIMFSPTKKWLVYFDGATNSWVSYNIITGRSQNLSKEIPYAITNENEYPYSDSLNYMYKSPVGIAGWVGSDSVLIYDDYDIWMVNLNGDARPLNLTTGYGRSHKIKFRLVSNENQELPTFYLKDTLLLTAFDTRTKLNGFYKQQVLTKAPPIKLFMGSFITYLKASQLKKMVSGTETFVAKAKDANVWIFSRRTDTLARNFYATSDFKSYAPVSNLSPQKDFNWLRAELINWKTRGGDSLSGILFKPEDFDPKKKYPVIFYYYEELSDELNNYPEPKWSLGDVNIAYFVSRGYIMCKPDIHYNIGHAGESALNCVTSAARYFSTLPYIDSKHMGICGHSFGGFETNYLVTHTKMFAAALSAAGTSDCVSDYEGLYGGTEFKGISKQFYYEEGQGRIGASLWQRPDLYLENSPILSADKVTTPLLLMHNKRDGSVSFSQSVAFFTALRRLDRPVWLLQYDQGVHIVHGAEARDFTIRELQFFDHYLKGAPPPIWMTEGIPARLKGIKTGLELDMRVGAK